MNLYESMILPLINHHVTKLRQSGRIGCITSCENIVSRSLAKKSVFWRVPNFWQPFLFLWISKICVFVYTLTRQPSIRFLSPILQESNLCSVLKRFSYSRNEMALQVSSAACFFRVFSHRNRRVHTTTVRSGVASEDFAALKSSEEEKLKLGASELKVTRLGIGAWSWGDTSYWNNFEWDGKSL